MRTEPLYVTLDATGNGSVRFIARKAGIVYRVGKVVCEMALATTGTVTLTKNGEFLSDTNVSAKMEARGGQILRTSEYLDAAVVSGPPSQEVKFTFFYDEEPDLPGLMTGPSLQWEQQPWPLQAVTQILNAQGVVQNTVQLLQGGKRLFVGTNPYVWIRMSVNAGGVRLTLQWFPSETATTAVASNFVDTRVTITAQGPITTMAPWVELVTECDANPRTINLAVWSAQSAAQESTPDAHIALITVDGTNVPGGGATTLFNPIRVRWGWGFWGCFVNAGTADLCRLYAVDYLGNTFLLDIVGSGISRVAKQILLPPMPIRVSVLNADAAAKAVYISVLMHPGPL